MTNEIVGAVPQKIDKDSLEARNALESGIQALYVALITGDHTFQGTYLPTMVDLIEQWVDNRDRRLNPNGENKWFISRLREMVSLLAMEKDLATDIRLNKEFFEGRFGSAYTPSPKCTAAALSLMEEVVNKLISEDLSDSQQVLKSNLDRTTLRALRQLLPQLNAARVEGMFVERQQDLINTTSRMMRFITELVFTNNLVKLKDIAFERSTHAKSLDPKKP